MALLVSAILQIGVIAYAHHDPGPARGVHGDDYDSVRHLREIAVRFEQTFYPRGRLSFQMPHGMQRECCGPPRLDSRHFDPLRHDPDSAARASQGSAPSWDVEASDFSAIGGSSASMTERIVEARADELARCFARTEETSTQSRSSASVEIQIDSKGTVTAVAFQGLDAVSLEPNARNCLGKRISRWTFLTYPGLESTVARFRLVATRSSEEPRRPR